MIESDRATLAIEAFTEAVGAMSTTFNAAISQRLDGMNRNVVALQDELKSDKASREAETAQQARKEAAYEKRATTNRRLGKVGVVAGVVGIIVGALGLSFAYRAQKDIDSVVAARTNARVIACQNANDASAKQHQLWEGILALPRAPGSAPPNEETLAQFRALLDQTFPTRSCDPAAVNAYYGGGDR